MVASRGFLAVVAWQSLACFFRKSEFGLDIAFPAMKLSEDEIEDGNEHEDDDDNEHENKKKLRGK